MYDKSNKAFDLAVASEFLERISTGRFCKQVGTDDDMPTDLTVRQWANGLWDAPPHFGTLYARARQWQSDSYAEDTLVIADSLDESIRREAEIAQASLGEDATNHQRARAKFASEQRSVAAAKEQIQARRWMASKLHPRQYGDKLDLTHATDPEAPPIIKVEALSIEELEQLQKIQKSAGVE